MKINPDDPLLTAYALGELDAAESRRLEAQLAAEPAAQETVEEIRAVAASLALDLSRQAHPGLGDQRRSKRDPGANRGARGRDEARLANPKRSSLPSLAMPRASA